jgi:fatty-acyl-CoA synthase
VPELNYCINKVGVKAIIAPETFKTQKYYDMISTLVPDMKNSTGQKIENNQNNSLQHVIIYGENKLQ